MTPTRIGKPASLTDITPSLSKSEKKSNQIQHDDEITVEKDTAEIVSLDTFRKEP